MERWKTDRIRLLDLREARGDEPRPVSRPPQTAPAKTRRRVARVVETRSDSMKKDPRSE